MEGVGPVYRTQEQNRCLSNWGEGVISNRREQWVHLGAKSWAETNGEVLMEQEEWPAKVCPA